jgi:Reverse transcriptase (RNA-dependent DNA polymerase)
MESPQREQWLKAMTTELKTLNENNTWTIVKNNSNIRPISTRWVYKIKKNDDKSLTYKARFVAKGFEQIQGLNYIENFAAVVKQQAFKVVFAIATIKGYIIYKIDIKSAFTHGNIDKTIYIQPSEGFNQGNGALLLNKALYGLKQAANIWFNALSTEIKGLNFKQLNTDNCIFYNSIQDTTIIIYVDDIAITGPDPSYIQSLISKLREKFTIKDLGAMKNYFKIEITRSKDNKTTILS